MLVAALGLLIAAFAAVSLWLSHRGRLTLKTWAASACLVAWVVGVGLKVHFSRSNAPHEREPAALAAAEGSSAWPDTRAVATVTGTASSETRVAPVESLVAGLEARLAKEPNDAKGWALLAQSYSFTGNPAGAEDAVKKAVALGFDEQSLREKVGGAARGPH